MGSRPLILPKGVPATGHNVSSSSTLKISGYSNNSGTFSVCVVKIKLPTSVLTFLFNVLFVEVGNGPLACYLCFYSCVLYNWNGYRWFLGLHKKFLTLLPWIKGTHWKENKSPNFRKWYTFPIAEVEETRWKGCQICLTRMFPLFFEFSFLHILSVPFFETLLFWLFPVFWGSRLCV